MSCMVLLIELITRFLMLCKHVTYTVDVSANHFILPKHISSIISSYPNYGCPQINS